MVLTWTLVLWNNLAGIGSYRIIELAGSENHGVGVSGYLSVDKEIGYMSSNYRVDISSIANAPTVQDL